LNDYAHKFSLEIFFTSYPVYTKHWVLTVGNVNKGAKFVE